MGVVVFTTIANENLSNVTSSETDKVMFVISTTFFTLSLTLRLTIWKTLAP